MAISKDTDQSSADEFMIVGDEEFNRDFHRTRSPTDQPQPFYHTQTRIN